MPIGEVAAEYEPPAPPYAWEVRWGAVSGYMTPVDSISVGRFDRKLAPQRLFPQPPPRRAPGLYRPNAAASARTDLVRSDLAWWLGHGETGPYGLTPSARPSTANTRARHCFLARASGPKLWPYACAVIKLNINNYEIWLPLAIKIMALHPTPLESLSHTQGDHKAQGMH
jgi:hypothetical protein